MIHSAGLSVSRKKEEMVKGEEWRGREARSTGKEGAEEAEMGAEGKHESRKTQDES